MVIEPGNPANRSVGSFFVNPVIASGHFAQIRGREGGNATIPHYPVDATAVKVPAAWLIERAGFPKGYSAAPVGVSPFQAQAIVNHGGATAADVARAGGRIKRAVWNTFSIAIVPEPVFVGFPPSPELQWLLESAFAGRPARLARIEADEMSTLVIEGGHRLHGRLDVEGNKNAALPLIAACLLTDEECVLHNVPRIADVEVMCRLLLDLGAEVDGIGTTTLRIRCAEVTKDEPDAALVGRLRGSVLLMGPLLARRGRAIIAPPGGDFPTRRTIRTHLEALAHMGVRVSEDPGHALEAPDGLKPASYYLDEASVTGTETALLAAAAAPGRTEIRHAACEPHVVELCEFLQAWAPAIEGGGSPTIRVDGAPQSLRGATQNAVGRLHRGGQLGGRRGDHRRAQSRSAARAGKTWKSSARCSRR